MRTSYEKLSKTIEQLFIKNFPLIFANKISARQQTEKGTYHTAKDKIPFLHLIEKKWWDTPVSSLCLEREQQIHLRKVKYEDIDFVFNIVNDPLVRKMSISTKTISKQEHKNWFIQKLQ